MSEPASVTITLDRPRTIIFTNRAVFRIGTLPNPPSFADLGKSGKSYTALCSWIWACLSPADALEFPTPEDVAAHVPIEKDRCRELAEKFSEAISSGTGEPKNERSSTKRSRSSNSA